MDIGFVLTYLICPTIISWGLVTGRKQENHLRLTTVYIFKGMFYLYSAMANIIHYVNQSWTENYVIGFAIGLAIIEGINGLYDGIDEAIQNAKEKN